MLSCNLYKKKSTSNISTTTLRVSNNNNIANKLTQAHLSNYFEKQKKQDKTNQKIVNQYKQNCQKPLKINDQNSSYTGNVLNQNCQKQNISKSQNLIETQAQLQKYGQNSQKLACLKEKPSQSDMQVVNLKKKIKKIDFKNYKECYFREKVRFIKKQYKQVSNLQRENDQKIKSYMKIQIQQKIEQFPIFRDSEVFPGLRNFQFRNRIVPQRMDNDIETDEEQVQKFVNKVKKEFTEHVTKYLQEKEKSKSNQMMFQ